MPPGRAAPLRRLGVEEEAVGDAGDRSRAAARSAASRTPIAFMTCRAEALLHAGDPLGRLLAVQLQPVRADGRDDVFEAGIVHVDGERHDFGAARGRGRRAPPARSSERKRGLGGKKTKPTMSAPAVKRRVERLLGRKPADLDDQMHAAIWHETAREFNSKTGGVDRNAP